MSYRFNVFFHKHKMNGSTFRTTSRVFLYDGGRTHTHTHEQTIAEIHCRFLFLVLFWFLAILFFTGIPKRNKSSNNTTVGKRNGGQSVNIKNFIHKNTFFFHFNRTVFRFWFVIVLSVLCCCCSFMPRWFQILSKSKNSNYASFGDRSIAAANIVVKMFIIISHWIWICITFLSIVLKAPIEHINTNAHAESSRFTWNQRRRRKKISQFHENINKTLLNVYLKKRTKWFLSWR